MIKAHLCVQQLRQQPCTCGAISKVVLLHVFGFEFVYPAQLEKHTWFVSDILSHRFKKQCDLLRFGKMRFNTGVD